MAVATTEIGTSTPARILDAAFAAIGSFGLSRITVEDVAQRAGLSRQTVYRYFASKDELIVALVSREEERILDGVRTVFESTDDLERAVAESTRFVLRFAREHPLLDRLLATDQASFLPYVTTRALPGIIRARETMVELCREKAPHADIEQLRTIIDGTTRSIILYILTPSDRPIDDVASTMARLLATALRKEGAT